MENIINEDNAKIKVFGVGGGGNNVINHMIKNNVTNVEFVAVNTDTQALTRSQATKKIQIGVKCTNGLGAGADPGVGRKAAEESRSEIEAALKGSDMVFIAAGMGGGSGTGAAPIVAQVAKEMGILTVGVVTMPFKFEGNMRMQRAIEGRKELLEQVDSLITIPNEKLREYLDSLGKKVNFLTGFQETDNVLKNAVQGISDLILLPGFMNVDFADIRTIMSIKGSSLMGIGFAEGEDRARKATEMAMKNPLLEHGIEGAKGIIVNVTGGPDFNFQDLEIASETIYSCVDQETTNIIIGTAIDESAEEGRIQVTIVATGFDENASPSSNLAKAEEKPLEVLKANVQEKGAETESLSKFSIPEVPEFLRNWNNK